MTNTPENLQRPSSHRPSCIWLSAPLAVCSLAMAWTFWPTLTELVHTWNTNQQYGHGWLVPIFAIYLLYHRREKLDTTALRPSGWGLVLLAGGLGLRLTSTYLYLHSFEQVSLIPCIAGVWLLLGGWAAIRWAWPSLLFLVFMIPLPFSIATALAGPLQSLATLSATFLMQTMGLPAISEGNVILINEHQIGIVEACSGLRMLVVFFALSTGVVLVSKRHWIDRTILFLSAVPIALLSNLVRITATGILYSLGMSETANHFFHDLAGWIMMPLALSMLWVELRLLDALFVDKPQTSNRPMVVLPRRTGAATMTRVPRSRRKLSEVQATMESQPQPVETNPSRSIR
ncbi:MAG: exosortase/archaeosortase family protein [Gemmataceae bacterium]